MVLLTTDSGQILIFNTWETYSKYAVGTPPFFSHLPYLASLRPSRTKGQLLSFMLGNHVLLFLKYFKIQTSLNKNMSGKWA